MTRFDNIARRHFPSIFPAGKSDNFYKRTKHIDKPYRPMEDKRMIDSTEMAQGKRKKTWATDSTTLQEFRSGAVVA